MKQDFGSGKQIHYPDSNVKSESSEMGKDKATGEDDKEVVSEVWAGTRRGDAVSKGKGEKDDEEEEESEEDDEEGEPNTRTRDLSGMEYRQFTEWAAFPSLSSSKMD